MKPELRSDIQKRLEFIRCVLPANCKEEEVFDEFVCEHEFELALHIVCDYIRESNSDSVEQQIIEHIQYLHSAMAIVDDCVQRLTLK
jgi:hypothetical protein